jgi:hypothetical protein
MHVHEPGEQVQTIGVEVPQALQIFARLGDVSGRQAHIHDAIEVGGRVHDVGAADY